MDLIDAIRAENIVMTMKLLKEGADVHQHDDSDKITPLHYAVVWGNYEVISLLVNYGADPHAYSADGSLSPMTLARSLKNWDVVKLFCMSTKNQLIN